MFCLNSQQEVYQNYEENFSKSLFPSQRYASVKNGIGERKSMIGDYTI